jgi:hypothetical protein
LAVDTREDSETEAGENLFSGNISSKKGVLVVNLKPMALHPNTFVSSIGSYTKSLFRDEFIWIAVNPICCILVLWRFYGP